MPWDRGLQLVSKNNLVLGMFCKCLSEESVNLITFHQGTLVVPEVNIAPIAEQSALFNVNFTYLICYQGPSRRSYAR